MAFGTFYAAGGTLARPGGTELTVGYWFRIRMCFLGGSQARLQPTTSRRSQPAEYNSAFRDAECKSALR